MTNSKRQTANKRQTTNNKQQCPAIYGAFWLSIFDVFTIVSSSGPLAGCQAEALKWLLCPMSDGFLGFFRDILDAFAKSTHQFSRNGYHISECMSGLLIFFPFIVPSSLPMFGHEGWQKTPKCLNKIRSMQKQKIMSRCSAIFSYFSMFCIFFGFPQE